MDGLAKSAMISLIPIGEVEEATLEALRQFLEEIFSQRTRIGNGLQLPRGSWNQHRGQHLATMLLALIPPPGADGRALGVVTSISLLPGLILSLERQTSPGREHSSRYSA